MKVRTPDGVGEVIRPQVLRGRTSYLVRGPSFEGWYNEEDVFKLADFSTPPPPGPAALMGDFSDIPMDPATMRDDHEMDVAELPWDDEQENTGDPTTSTLFQDETDAEDTLHYDSDRGTDLPHQGIPAQASVKTSNLGCPDCGNEELHVNSDTRDDGTYDAECPTCGWQGQGNEYNEEGSPNDLADYDYDDDLSSWMPGFGGPQFRPSEHGDNFRDHSQNSQFRQSRTRLIHSATNQSTGRSIGLSRISEDLDTQDELNTGIGSVDTPDFLRDESFGYPGDSPISDQSGFESDLDVESIPSSSPTPGTGKSFEDKPEGRGITSSLIQYDELSFLDKIAEEGGYSRRKSPLGDVPYDRQEDYKTRDEVPWFMRNRPEDKEKNNHYRDTGGYDGEGDGSSDSDGSGDSGGNNSGNGSGGGSSTSSVKTAGVGQRYKRTRGERKSKPLGKGIEEHEPQQPAKNHRLERGIKGEEASKPTRGRRRKTPAQPKGTHFASFDLHFAANLCKCSFAPLHSKSEHLEITAQTYESPLFRERYAKVVEKTRLRPKRAEGPSGYSWKKADPEDVGEYLDIPGYEEYDHPPRITGGVELWHPGVDATSSDENPHPLVWNQILVHPKSGAWAHIRHNDAGRGDSYDPDFEASGTGGIEEAFNHYKNTLDPNAGETPALPTRRRTAELEKGPEFSGSAEVDKADQGVTPMDGLSVDEIEERYPGLAGRGIPEDPDSGDDNLNMAHLDQILTHVKRSSNGFLSVDRNGPHCGNCGEDAQGDPETWISQHTCQEAPKNDYQFDPSTLGFPVDEEGYPVENERHPLHTFGLRYPDSDDVEEIDVHAQDPKTARAMAEHKAHIGYQPGWEMFPMEPGGSGGYVQIYHGSVKTSSWRPLPNDNGMGPTERFEHISGGTVEQRGYQHYMAHDLYGGYLGEYPSQEEAQSAVETDAEGKKSHWKYLDTHQQGKSFASRKTAGDPQNQGGAPQGMPMGGPQQQQMQIEMQIEQLMKFWAVDNFGWWHWTGSQQDLAMLNQMQQSMMPVMQPSLEPQGPQQEPGMNPSSPMGPLAAQSSKKNLPKERRS